MKKAMANKIKVKFGRSSEPKKEDLGAAVARLRAELQEDQPTNRQLQREKALQVQQMKDQSQTQAAKDLRDLAEKLNLEKRQEIELQKEILRNKLESDNSKVVKVKEQEIKKLKQDLARCQNDLADEVSKRGLSTSARATFELERQKLLQEVRELSLSKKRVESELQTASEALKRKNLEFRQLEEIHKVDLVRVEKAANSEVKKLLEELKTKDNMLSMMDRSIHTDKTNMLMGRIENLSILELLNLSREVEKSTKRDETASDEPCVVSTGCALQTIGLQKKLYDMEKQLKFANGVHQTMMDKNRSTTSLNKELEGRVKHLSDQINNMRSELLSSKTEIERLNETLVTCKVEEINESQLEVCNQRCTDLESIIASLRKECKDKDRNISLLLGSQQKRKHKYRRRKSVRFLLPEDNSELNEASEENDDSVVEETEEARSQEILITNVHKDYEKLMAENLKLSKYYAILQEKVNLQTNVEKEVWFVEKEALHLRVCELSNQLREAEERENLLRFHLEEAREEKEENEFRIFELEECAEKAMTSTYDRTDVELMERNRFLEMKLNQLTQRLLSQYEVIDLTEMENDSRLETDKSVAQLIETTKEPMHVLSVENLRKLSSSLSSSDDDNPMVQSFSTVTSGFDEISCVSLELDDKSCCQEASDCCEGQTVLARAEQTSVIDLSQAIKSNNQETKEMSVDMNQQNATEICTETSSLEVASVSSDLSHATLDSQHNEGVIQDSQTKELSQYHIQRMQELEEQVEILAENDAVLSMTIEALECLDEELMVAIMDDIQIENRIPQRSVAASNSPIRFPLNFREEPNSLTFYPNTAMQVTGREEKFGFLSPTCLGSEWGMIDSKENTLHLQMLELEREREHLQDRVCKGENIICDLRKHISVLEKSERNLKNLVERLETAETIMRERYLDMESLCDELKRKLKRSESNENLLKQQLDTLELSHSAQLQNLVDVKTASDAKFKRKISELEQVKCCLESQVDELASSVKLLEDREISTKQKLRCLEESENGLKEKVDELEQMLSVELNTSSRLNRQRDQLSQEILHHEEEVVEYKREVFELTEEKMRLESEVERLTESVRCSSDVNQGDAWPQTRSHEDRVECNCEPLDQSTQTDQTVIQQVILGIKNAIQRLRTGHSVVYLEFVSCIINSLAQNCSCEEMKKFISSTKLKCSNNQNVTDRQLTVKKLENAKSKENEAPDFNEEALWAIVEDPQDIYDIRLADQSQIWLALEQLIGVSTDDVELGLERGWAEIEFNKQLSDASIQTIECMAAWQVPKEIQSFEPSSRHPAASADHGSESADEVSEIHDEDDGALLDLRTSLRSDLFMSKTQPTRRGRSRSAGVLKRRLPDDERKTLQKSSVGVSVESVTDSGIDSTTDSTHRAVYSLLDHSIQSEKDARDDDSLNKTVFSLLEQLENKDKTLFAQMQEMDRMSEEMRIWQQKAAEASDQINSMTHILAATTQELNFMKEVSSQNTKLLSNNLQETSGGTRKARLEPHVSQIPVSLRQQHAAAIKTLSVSKPTLHRSPSASTTVTVNAVADETRGSVHTADSSLPHSYISYLPRLVTDENKLQEQRSENGSKREAQEAVAREAISLSTEQHSKVEDFQ